MFKLLIAVPMVAGLLAMAAGSAAAADEMKFEIYKDKGGEFRWRLKAANGTVMATPGQGYKALADAKNGIETVKKSASDDKMKYETYEDAKQEHRWRLKAGNGRVVASSSEGYTTKAGAEKSIETIKAGVAKATVIEAKE